MENISAKELIDYYKKLTEYIKNLETKKNEVMESLEADKAQINTENPEEAGVFDIDEEGDEEDDWRAWKTNFFNWWINQ